jgi:predicted SAM-dependent methyltransferase
MSLKLQIDQMAQQPERKLQLGCGTNVLPGWINTDSTPPPLADYLDFTKRLPFPDGSFDAVFCEHTVEHIAKPMARAVFGEVFRILRSGGAFRVVTPALENFCRMALEPQSETTQKYLAFVRRYLGDPNATIADAINKIFYGHGHQHIYTVEELGGMLQQVGFGNLRLMKAGSYVNPIFNGVDGHGKVIGEDINAIESMAIEATKP